MPGAARLHDLGDCYPPPHGIISFVDTTPDVFINGRNAEHVGCVWSCGAVQVQGSPNVFVNSQPLARLGDLFDHGGPVITCSPNVIINEL